MASRLFKIFVCSIYVSLILLPGSLCRAQDKMIFERVDFSNGQPVGKLNCLFKDKKGFLWLGSNNGLHRYDGKKFISFSCNTNQPYSLPSSLITDIAQDSRGRLWIGTSEGLSLFDPDLKKFLTIYPYANKKLPAFKASVKPVYIDEQDRVWFGTDAGLEMIDQRANTRKFIPIYRDIKKMQRLVSMNNIVPGKKDEIWLATLQGIYSLDTKKFTWKNHIHPNNGHDFPTHNFATDIRYVNDTLVWVATWSGGLKRFNPRTGKFTTYRYSYLLPDNTGSVNVVIHILPDREKNGRDFVWLCTADNGLGKFYPDDESFIFYRTSETDVSTIDDNAALDIIREKDSIYWIATNVGLNKIDMTRQRFSYIEIPNHENPQVMINTVTAFAEDVASRKVYVGTYLGGVYCWNRNTGQVTKIPTKPGLELGYVKSMIFSQSKLYIAANENYIYDPVRNQTTVHHKLQGHAVSLYLRDQNGFWVFDYQRPFMFYDPVKDSLSEPAWADEAAREMAKNIYAAFIDRDGKIWLGSGVKGVGVFDKQTGAIKVYKTGTRQRELIDILGFEQDASGKIWMASDRQGLAKFDPQTEKFEHIAITDGIPTDELYGIQKDKDDRLWIISLKGLIVVDAASGEITNFTRRDGLESDIMLNGFMPLSDGLMLIGQPKGFNTIQSHHLFRNRKKPDIFITGFKINNQDFYYSGQKEIRLNHDQNNIQLEFAALNFSSPEKNRYRYMLEGADRNWTQPGSNNLVNYAALEPGRYVFKVKASNNDNQWTTEPFELKLVILPPYWKTWWFQFLIVLLVLLLLYIAYRFRLKQLARLQRMRNKIADDLHDEVGSALSSISLLSGMAKSSTVPHQQTMKKIEETSRETVENMSDIVWSIQPRNDRLTDVVKRMKNYGQQLFVQLNTAFEFKDEQDLTDLPLNMEQRKNLYFIYKEALNNAAKYAGADKISVSISNRSKQVVLVISDNGKGFDAKAPSGGNGLYTMHERARILNGSLDIASTPGAGTTITLKFKTT